MVCTNDTPINDAELDAFYGRTVTESERMDAIRRQSEAFDKDDLVDVLYEHGDSIISDLREGCFTWLGYNILDAYKATIARRASIELYGKPDVIKASEVV